MGTRVLGAFQKLGRMADTCSLSFHSILAVIEEESGRMQLSAQDHGTVAFKRSIQALATRVVQACLAHVRGSVLIREWEVARFCFSAYMQDDYVLDGILERSAVAMVAKKNAGGKGPGGLFTEEGWRALYAGAGRAVCARDPCVSWPVCENERLFTKCVCCLPVCCVSP
jgi:hypothetical protein